MNLVVLTHPDFLRLRSHQQFSHMLVQACRARGHTVELRQPAAVLRRRVRGVGAKWAGYFDQYILFPFQLRKRAAADPANTLYVFCDQALGPWMPALAARPHVVHCHDLLALRSALGDIPENPTALSGRVYQRYIRRGFRHARHFISISEQSRSELHAFGGVDPITSEVVHNGLSHPFTRRSSEEAAATLARVGLQAPANGLLLHVGGGQWYKNTDGVMSIYGSYAASRCDAVQPVPELWVVGPEPAPGVQRAIATLPSNARVRFLQSIGTDVLEALYSVADALLFPSLAEGFGWPIAEALSCGCPVLTSAVAPMTAVGGPHAHYVSLRTADEDLTAWGAQGARILSDLAERSPLERSQAAAARIGWASQFAASYAIDSYLRVYAAVLQHGEGRSP